MDCDGVRDSDSSDSGVRGSGVGDLQRCRCSIVIEGGREPIKCLVDSLDGETFRFEKWVPEAAIMRLGPPLGTHLVYDVCNAYALTASTELSQVARWGCSECVDGRAARYELRTHESGGRRVLDAALWLRCGVERPPLLWGWELAARRPGLKISIAFCCEADKYYGAYSFWTNGPCVQRTACLSMIADTKISAAALQGFLESWELR